MPRKRHTSEEIVAKLRLEKKGRGGKSVTVVYDLPANAAFLKELCQANGMPLKTLTRPALTLLSTHTVYRGMAWGIGVLALTYRSPARRPCDSARRPMLAASQKWPSGRAESIAMALRAAAMPPSSAALRSPSGNPLVPSQ